MRTRMCVLSFATLTAPWARGQAAPQGTDIPRDGEQRPGLWLVRRGHLEPAEAG